MVTTYPQHPSLHAIRHATSTRKIVNARLSRSHRSNKKGRRQCRRPFCSRNFSSYSSRRRRPDPRISMAPKDSSISPSQPTSAESRPVTGSTSSMPKLAFWKLDSPPPLEGGRQTLRPSSGRRRNRLCRRQRGSHRSRAGRTDSPRPESVVVVSTKSKSSSHSGSPSRSLHT